MTQEFARGSGSGSLRFLALGDSYTIGESVEPAQRWPVKLVSLLRDSGFNLAEPEIIATTGWTTDELAAGIESAAPQGAFDLVALLIGVNNQYRSRPLVEYRQQFRHLLETAATLASNSPQRVVVVSIPDWGVTPFAANRDGEQIARQVDAFNVINRAEAKALGAHYIDITPISRQHPTLTAPDGLHPSGPMYTLWAEAILPTATAALGNA